MPVKRGVKNENRGVKGVDKPEGTMYVNYEINAVRAVSSTRQSN